MYEKDTLTDSELVERISLGDEIALKIIFSNYWQPLFISAYNILKDKQVCEDIIQELFIKLWNKRKNLTIKVSLKAYLYACVRYEVYKQIKAGNVREEIFEHLTQYLYTKPADENLEHKELLTQINSVIDKLPEKCREVYKLSREEQLSHKEIASRLNISTKTVENHLTKALRQLRLSIGNTSVLLVVFDILSQHKK